MFKSRGLIGIGFCLFILAAIGSAQDGRDPVPAGSTVIAVATDKRVRFTSLGTVVQLRLEVYNETGQKLFDTELRGGNVLDWHLQDGGGERVAAGSYAFILTTKALTGRLSQRLGSVTVTDTRTTIGTARMARLTDAQQAAIGPVEETSALTVLTEPEVPSLVATTHDGTMGQVTATTGPLTFRTGNIFNGTDKERMRITEDGKVGIGTDDPEAELDVAGVLKARKGFTFFNGSTLNVKETGGLSLTKADGTAVPDVSGTGTTGRLAKWTDGPAGALGDSVAFDTGTGLQMTAAASNLVDTNVMFTSGNDRTTGMIASSTASFLSSNGPYFAIRGNTYSAIPNQRGLFAVSAGNVPSPTGFEGKILFFTGNDQLRMVVTPTGNVGIGTTNPTATLDVAGNINTSTQYNIGGQRAFTMTGGGFSANSNTFAGLTAGANNAPNATTSQGNYNAFFGREAGFGNTTGHHNSYFGETAGRFDHIGEFNAGIGSFAGGEGCDGSGNTFLGSYTGCGEVTNLTNATAVGFRTFVTQSNSVVLGSIVRPGLQGNYTRVGIGISSPVFKLHVTDTSNTGLRVETLATSGKVASFGGRGDFQIDAELIVGGRLNVLENGNVGIGEPTPNAKLHVTGGDVRVAGGDVILTTQFRGVVLRAHDGPNCFRLVVSNIGQVAAVLLPSCP